MKETIKRLIPESLIARLRGLEADMKLRHETIHQMKRFRRSYARRGSMRREHLETRIIFFTHQIEKGLSHTDFRYGFGKGVLAQMAPLMASLRKTDTDIAHNDVYQTAISALHEYRTRHEEAHVDLAYMRELFDAAIWNDIATTENTTGGAMTIRAADKRHNGSLTFTRLMEERHSVREFADEPVSAAEITKAVDAAMRTPSVCNRQPTRVHIITNPQLIRHAMPLQGGFRGYPMPPALVLITADNQAFMNQDERNEGYTDGGLFGMSLLLALEEQGLAACPLNTMLPMKRDEATRALLGIPDSEFLVMYIAVGHFRDEVKTCKSQRFPADGIVTVHA
ncbi:nitroreductase family protein [Bifidobacterium sp. 82T24]|uniref:nitroreductase family protein n=1 Tax=Bifidobacterium pluvialisilvae TaxID=2834436 RepID=UPI001C55CD1B|nr:nitroreductase family protein [Bifidobacterium pluvialisilvae]MBW3087483.1 nitroreductase family protein [Bifidobacterium pluvialisilvae]